jgi:NTE family protein
VTDRALVLAGGGLAGIAWETGVLLGLRDAWAGLDAALAAADTLFVGTSAGSAVASQVAAGVDLERLYATQLAEESAELGSDIDLETFTERVAGATAGATSESDARRRLGAFARAAATVDPEARKASVAARLLAPDWPDRMLRIAAVDAESGELRVFEPDSGVPMVDAIGASCAVPGVWPVVPIEGHLYMDGGTRTMSNADLAAGARRVLILAPLPADGLGVLTPEELAALAPAPVDVIAADEAAVASFGGNPLDPATRPAAAREGRRQGRAAADRIAALWA